ncbi:tRNA:m4X modification enzyme [Mycoemilia scoparia]|uniref:tRNA:m(4)X modification enzyme TRM13 n=1 Tax=Mycoemilia scoparia TaxID=417184 RepID=A0A9W8A460_9FUNG|nr:tRNA:m4X modification enzyme [Mycoemilia scoparia]
MSLSESAERPTKKVKRQDGDPNKEDIKPTRCHFWVEKHKRYCLLIPKKNQIYCGEHAMYSASSSALTMATGEANGQHNNEKVKRERIPCPFDTSHTVDIEKLTKHMRYRCNSRPKDFGKEHPPYLVRDINITTFPPDYESKYQHIIPHNSEDDVDKDQDLMLCKIMSEGLSVRDPKFSVNPGDIVYLVTKSKLYGNLQDIVKELVNDPEQKIPARIINLEQNNNSTTSQNNKKQQDKEISTLSQSTSFQNNKGLIYNTVVSRFFKELSDFLTIQNISKESNIELPDDLNVNDMIQKIDTDNSFPIQELGHPTLIPDLTQSKYDQKHITQHASIVGHLEKAKLLSDEYTYIEFGAGKGELTSSLMAAMGSEKSSKTNFILVDRKNFRQKFNGKEPNQMTNSLHRVFIDIRDLKLSELDYLKSNDGNNKLKPIVAFSKHLCGSATDLTIKCLENYRKAGGQVAGFVVALCCHQLCKYSMYPNPQYIEKYFGNLAIGKDTTPALEAFDWDDGMIQVVNDLAGMSSWAICGPPAPSKNSTKNKNDNSINGSNSDANDANEEVNNHYSGLTYSQRNKVGFAIKRLFDFGRIEYLRTKVGFKNIELVQYVPKKHTLENLLLVASNADTISES